MLIVVVLEYHILWVIHAKILFDIIGFIGAVYATIIIVIPVSGGELEKIL